MIRLGNKMNQYQRLIDNLTKLNLNNMAASIADYRQQIDEFAIIKRTLSLLAVPTWAKHTYPSDLVSKHAGKACEHYS